MPKGAATIDLYLTGLPEDQRAALEHLREAAQPAASSPSI